MRGPGVTGVSEANDPTSAAHKFLVDPAILDAGGGAHASSRGIFDE
jgi:hypothetical protein